MSCPLCRINASEADVIKLFIQESTEIDPKLPEEPYLESKHEGYLLRKMNICKCEFYQYDIGNLWYKCLKEYNVQIKYEEKKRETTVTLPNGYSLTISTSLKTELLHKKGNGKTTINPDGTILTETISPIRRKRKSSNIPEKVEKQSNTELVRHYRDYIKFTRPGFTLSRSLKAVEAGQITLRVETADPKNYLKIIICPKHQIFKVEHFMGKKTIKCPIAEMKCQHLKK
uniref:SWIM-type domain-containing protein n=1 Tax=Panagrolaimus davidi TaxID=227884 RepID=A0A914P725_9BILA